MLVLGTAAVCYAAGPPAAGSPAGYGHVQTVHKTTAEIDKEGVRVAADAHWGDITCKLALEKRNGLILEAFSIRHPAVTAGFVRRGDLFRLITSPSGDWDRVSEGALYSAAKAAGGEEVPGDYGLVLSPIPEKFALYSFFESDLSLCGAYLRASTSAASIEALASISQPVPAAESDDWLLEHRPARGRSLGHCLLRVSVKAGLLHVYGGAVVSSARHTPLQVACSTACVIDYGYVALSARASGGTRGYFSFDRSPVRLPLSSSWRLEAGRGSPVTAFFEHQIEIEPLPLVHIPFRETDETLHAGFCAGLNPFELKGDGALRIQTDRSAAGEVSVRGALALKGACAFGSAAIEGEVSRDGDLPPVWTLGLPVEARKNSFACGIETTLERDEYYRLHMEAKISAGEVTAVRWYASAKAVLSRSHPFEYGYRLGWQISR